MTANERHLSGDSFASFLNLGVPVDHPLDGTPRLILFIDPDNGRIGLRGPLRAKDAPAATGLEHLSIQIVHLGGERMVEIAVDNPALFADAYPVLCGVADRAQLDGMSLSEALRETLRRLGHLIRAEEKLTREVETGLLGELVLLIGLATTERPEVALRCWRSGGEEHDFGLRQLDVEVKTTTSESRIHHISSLTQLQQTGDQPLWLLSLQVTTAGAGGTTLAELIQRVRALLPTPALRDDFDECAHAAGWRHRYADAPMQRWRLRTEPSLFAVTAGFPRLTPALLSAAGIDLGVVKDIRYRLDLSSRPFDQAPEALRAAVAAGKQELP
ncbi:PD-(D/E)XK motif protein [Actinoplanes sp. NPDC051633]|uniref:PD-(D/E)XK motif protein n=1 Tax=Actinoplanes sp. NPDC051633 TaxID=3155670 RepID=UPI00342EF3DB